MKYGARTYAYEDDLLTLDDEDQYFQEEDQDQFTLESDLDGDPKSMVDWVWEVSLNHRRTLRRTLYQQDFEAVQFRNNAPYQGTLSSTTEYWYNHPMPRRQELPIERDGEWVYNYEDPVEKPQIHFRRYIHFKLNSGNVLRFAIYGVHTISETLAASDKLGPEKLESLFGQTDSPFCVSALDTQDLAGLEGFSLELSDKSSPNESMNEVLRNLGMDDLIKVNMSARDQHEFIIKFLEAYPAIHGWLSDNIQTKDNRYPTRKDAEDAARQTRHSVLTQNGDEFSTKIIGLETLAALAEQLRNRETEGEMAGGEVLEAGERVIDIKYQGQSISESQLKELFFTTVENAVLDPNGEKTTNVLVYRIEGDFFGRKLLDRKGAHEIWRKLDENTDPEGLETWDVKTQFGIHWNGTFLLLESEGTYQSHRINADYYRGRRVLMTNKDNLNQSFGNDINDGVTQGYAELVTSGPEGELMRLYIRGELDRPVADASYFRSVLETHGSATPFALSFQSELGEAIYREVKVYAQDYAYEKVAEIAIFLNRLGSSRGVLETQLESLPSKNAEERRNIITSFGYEDDALDHLCEIFSDKDKAAQIVLGLKVQGFTIEGIIARVQESAEKMGGFAGDLRSESVDALAIEGEFGNDIRTYAYEKVGFKALNPTKFPHHDEANSTYGIIPGLQFTNTREQLYAYYVHNVAKWKKIGTIILVVIVVVILALISAGIGLYAAGVAGATGWGAVGVTGLVGGITFTILTEAIMQIMGAGTIDQDKDLYGLDEFFVQMLFNVVVFTLFGGAGKLLKDVSFGIRVATMGVMFFTYSIIQFRIDNGRFPEGYEWYFIALENVLALVLFEVGMVVARGSILRILSRGYSKYAQRMTAKFNKVQLRMIESQKNVAHIASGEKKGSAFQLEVAENYVEQLREMEALLQKYEQKAEGTGWQLENEKGELLTEAQAKEQRKLILEKIENLETAIYGQKSGIRQVFGTETAQTYNGTKQGADLIREKHKGQGDKVSRPDQNGIIKVETASGETLLYLPEAGEGTLPLQEALLAESSLTGSMRKVSGSIMAVDRGKIPKVEEQFRDGTWQEIQKDKLYLGEKTVNGKTVKMFFMIEENLYIADAALKAESQSPGAGMAIIKSSLRSKEAVDGFNDYANKEWKNLSEGEQVKELWKLEQNGKEKGNHLNEILEKRSREAKIEEEARIKAETDAKRGKLIGATNNNYNPIKMDPQYIGEEHGKKFDDPFGNPMYVEYFSDAKLATFEVFVGENDGLLYNVKGELINTANAYNVKRMGQKVPGNAIIVMDLKGRIYLSNESAEGKIHHSSFLGGKDVAVAGEADINQSKGGASVFNNNSGHYQCDFVALDAIHAELKARGAKMDRIRIEPFNKK
jgi:hypothetical protein